MRYSFPAKMHIKHRVQVNYFNNNTNRFFVLPCGRRSGKTDLTRYRVIKEALKGDGHADGIYAVCAPTRSQVKNVWWEKLKKYSKPFQVKDPSESELTIHLINSNKIMLFSLEKSQRIEGLSLNMLVIDETADVANLQTTWQENLLPTLIDRDGKAFLIGVPGGAGYYEDLYNQGLNDPTGIWKSYHWTSEEILTPAQIQIAKANTDPIVYEQEYLGRFISWHGKCYYNFSRDKNVGAVEYNPRKPLLFGFDFNVSPGVAIVAQEMKITHEGKEADGLGVLDEVWVPRNSNTPIVCRRLLKDWEHHPSDVHLFGDATGGARGTAKVSGSDWDLIKAEMRGKFPNIFYKVPESNPAERARVNSVNSICQNTLGEVRLKVNPKCVHLIKDLEAVRLLEGGSGEIDKKHDDELTHISDAFGYISCRLFPTTNKLVEQSRLNMF